MNQELSFGAFVRQHRREMDLTQEELARRVGCAAITLRKIEANDLRASVQIAERLAMALAIPLEDRAEFVRWARSIQPASFEPQPVTPAPSIEEIGREDLTGRAIRGYALAERIGMGGMGTVYRAVQPNVEREVAVKIILPAFANHPDFIRRFEAEAQLVARLEHPHIVPLYDYWREPGVAYLVMRLLRGGNVQSLVAQGPLSIDSTTRMLDQICAALNAAHRIGVIHRDLKPANVLLDEDNNAYLADFGIAKNLGNPDIENQTQADAMIGSPQYMSPEQIRSLSVRPQTDVYCLGVMLYEMLTGALPFTGPTPFDMIQQHINTPMPPLSAHLSGLPSALDAVIARATAKDPDERYPDAPSLFQEFRQAIGKISGEPIQVITYVEEDTDAVIIDPFKGLRAFGEADVDHFFGRETLVQQLLARLSEGGELSRFLAVIGPSGSGKSSVVRAGLIPALRRGGLPGSENWFVVDMLPGKYPFEELESSLLRVAINPPESLLSQLKDGNRGLLRAVHRILPADESVELVLVIDQFEEVFTLMEDENERALLLESLATAVLDERSRLRVVITLRADFTDKPLRYVDFGELMNRRFEFVLPLTSDEVERAIAGPAQRVGLKLEKGLVSTIIRDTGNQPGTLPLLQYALSELFEKREKSTLTNKTYKEIGGVLGALGRSAEQAFTKLDQSEQAAARKLFLRLVTLGEGTEDTRRRVLRSELDDLTASGASEKHQESSTIIDHFGKARLLSFDHDPITRGATVEVAHEALLREWTRLREWLRESRSDVRLQRQLATAANEWQNANCDESFLMTGSRLEQFEDWASNTTIGLTQFERSFLESSVQLRDRRESEEHARQQRELEAAQKLAETERHSAINLRIRNRVITAVGSVAIVLAILAGMFGLSSSRNSEQALNAQAASLADAQSRATAESIAINERNIAQQQSLIASVRELSSEANLNLEVDPERSILLALHAVNQTYAVDQTVLPEAEDALRRAVQALRVELTLNGHTNTVWDSTFSPDGTRIASASDDGTARLWDATTGMNLLTLSGHGGGVFSVAFSPDGTLLVTASVDKTARVWDAATGQQIMTLESGSEEVFDAIFSPDGKQIATAITDGTVQIWDASTGGQLLILREEGEATIINEIAFSPDGKRIVFACEDGEVGWASVWDAATGEKLFRLEGHTIQVRSVAFSPDGSRLVTGSADRTVKLWNASDGKELLTIYGHTDVLSDVAFSPDSSRVVTAGWDRIVRIWDANTGQQLLTLAGHSDQIWSASFSPDGKRIVTAGIDKAIRVWSLSPSRELITVVNGPALPSPAPAWVAFSPDGNRIVASNVNPTPEVWDITTGKLLFNLVGHMQIVRGVVFSSDGTRIATASDDRTPKIWDANTGETILTFPARHNDIVVSVALSPDGTRLATGSFDRSAKVWDAITGEELWTLSGHTLQVVHVAFSPDGTRLATASFDGTAKVWDVTTGKELMTILGHTNSIRQVVFSSDGKRLATASFDGTAKVWDSVTGKELMTLSGHAGIVFSVAFSPDDSIIATGSTDGTAKIWDAATGRELLTLSSDGGGVTNVAFSPDGSRLATANRDGTDRIYLLRIEDLVALAKQRVTRSLTTEECHQFLHVATCPAQP